MGAVLVGYPEWGAPGMVTQWCRWRKTRGYVTHWGVSRGPGLWTLQESSILFVVVGEKGYIMVILSNICKLRSFWGSEQAPYDAINISVD